MEISRAYDLGRALMDAHGLADWTLVFDRAKKRAGCTRFSERVISLSRPITELCDDAEVRETILHEIAHALVGPRHNHDAVWRAKCAEIGGTPSVRMVDGPQILGAWTGVCPAGHTVNRHRRPTRAMSCATCLPGRFSHQHVFRWYNERTGERI
ncbi:MAG: SprT family zinc-dependent metalloprotease [Actinomycetaceae bacterium]|nr:SprT family zinc-dependent metalloprotease [Actinomycetaceae bacterium]